MFPVAFWGPWGSAYPPSTPAGLYGQAGGTVKTEEAGPFRDLLPLDTEINFTNMAEPRGPSRTQGPVTQATYNSDSSASRY